MNLTNFKELLEKFTNIESSFDLKIKGVNRRVVFVASYNTEHFSDDEYLKIFFADGTILEIMPSTEELYFCDDMRREVDRSLVSEDGKILNIDGKQFSLDNGDDQQFVKQIYFGDAKDGEEECVFSDYSCGDEVWSLAILPNGAKSDVHVKKISLSDLAQMRRRL